MENISKCIRALSQNCLNIACVYLDTLQLLPLQIIKFRTVCDWKFSMSNFSSEKMITFECLVQFFKFIIALFSFRINRKHVLKPARDQYFFVI